MITLELLVPGQILLLLTIYLLSERIKMAGKMNNHDKAQFFKTILYYIIVFNTIVIVLLFVMRMYFIHTSNNSISGPNLDFILILDPISFINLVYILMIYNKIFIKREHENEYYPEFNLNEQNIRLQQLDKAIMALEALKLSNKIHEETGLKKVALSVLADKMGNGIKKEHIQEGLRELVKLEFLADDSDNDFINYD